MGLFERIKSAASGAIPVEDDLDMGNSQRVRNLPESASPSDAARADEVPAPPGVDIIEVSAYSNLPQPEDPRVAYVSGAREYVLTDFPLATRQYVSLETYNPVQAAPTQTAAVVDTESVVGSSIQQNVDVIEGVISPDQNTILSSLTLRASFNGTLSISDSEGELISRNWSGGQGGQTISFAPGDYPRSPVGDITITVTSTSVDGSLQYRLDNPPDGSLYSMVSGDLPSDFGGNAISLEKYEFL